MQLFRFDGDSCKWPDFIQNFKNQVHDICSFTDDIQMERLLSILDGEAKQTVISIGRNSLFLKSVLDLSQITNQNCAGLRAFHQQLKSVTVQCG